MRLILEDYRVKCHICFTKFVKTIRPYHFIGKRLLHYYYLLVIVFSCDILITIMFEDLTPVLDGLMTKEQW